MIIDRRVNIGETVASSLNTPSLFLIAKDLTNIQVWASVNEADIGNIHPGQPVTFTVDAFPNRVFHGLVNKVRLNATMTQNVVTYTVEVNTDNSDGKLLPYLTANVNFLTGEATNALLVLNSALRWHPQNDLIAPAYRQPVNGAGGTSAGAGAADSSGANKPVAALRGSDFEPEGARASGSPGAPAARGEGSRGGGRRGGERGGGGNGSGSRKNGDHMDEGRKFCPAHCRETWIDRWNLDPSARRRPGQRRGRGDGHPQRGSGGGRSLLRGESFHTANWPAGRAWWRRRRRRKARRHVTARNGYGIA